MARRQAPLRRPVRCPGRHRSDRDGVHWTKPRLCDRIEKPVRWRDDGALAGPAGKAVRLRFVLREADLVALRFGE